MLALLAFLPVDDGGMSAAHRSKQSQSFLGEVMASSTLVSERALQRKFVPLEVVTVLVRRHRGE